MCDYSLQNVASRPAQVGEKLVTKNFGTGTTGFASAESDDKIAVCVLPGTELAFMNDITPATWYAGGEVKACKVARFRQIDKDVTYTHHDALELATGEIVRLNSLAIGQFAVVLQLPNMVTEKEREEAKRIAVVG